MKIRTRTGEKDSHRISLPGKACIYWGKRQYSKRAKSQRKLHWGMSNKETLLEKICKMRCYRLLGNKLKETCDLNTGYWVKEQQAQEEWISKTGIRVRDINQPNIWERPEKGTSTQENLTPQGTKVIIGSRKEGTPGIPITGYIIGDRPKRELVYMPKHSSSERRAWKSKSTYRMDIRIHNGKTNLTQLGTQTQRVHEI